MRAEVKQGVGNARWRRCAFAVAALGVLAAGIAWQAAAAAAGVLKVRFGGDQVETRMVIELDRSTSANLVSADGGDRRLVLRFDKVSAAGGMDGRGLGLIGAWKLDRGANLTLDLTRNARIKRRFLLPPSAGAPSYRYVIDAGHGGNDPGAIGKTSREKDVTLAAARALKRRLETSGRYRVVMTRDRDAYVPLETRVQIARQANADLFISLHADAAADAQTRGATVYTLSEQGTDRAARRVFSGGSFIDVDLPGRDRAVKQILLDLTQRATKNRSGAFAEMLLSEISDKTTLLRRSHRDAGFVVLLAPDVPAVLMEMGFMSNRDDERGLNDAAHRNGVMNAVGDSIDTYFARQVRYAAR